MNGKKHLPKYALCLILYISICLSLLLIRINQSSSAKVIRNLSYPVTTKPPTESYDTPIDTQVIESSLQRIASVCEKYNKTTSLERKHFFHDPSHNALFCWIRKVASTSFTKMFAELRGIQMERNYYKASGFLSPATVEDFLNLVDDMGVFKFLAVRHPFERLVSSYRSRIEDNSKYSSQAWIFVPRIFHQTRPHLFHFNETIQSPMQQIFHNNRRLKLVPTFQEFVSWLLTQSEENDDEHWSQYHSHCSICQMNFDYVLKVDDELIHEFENIFTRLNPERREWKLVKLGGTRGGATNFQRTCDYLSTLTSDTLQRLYQRYKIDFDMFDYSPRVYEACKKTYVLP
ncbi:carbohydrate sulfotransferase 11 [Fopius arisanus]|uniref:Carbohydrate sulfotransferase n=1 Tax=Fopius arisanus TaxID=64838 RepID=A0A0C9R9G1_9HYME|nr:PREDICTED: carbohydrate sulfotransferase 11-like [Fopius arisanus]